MTTDRVDELDDELSILDMSLLFSREEPLCEEITDISQSVKGDTGDTDVADTSRTSTDDELEKRYRF